MVRVSSSLTNYFKIVGPAISLVVFGAASVFFSAAIGLAVMRGAHVDPKLIFFVGAFAFGFALTLVTSWMLYFPLKHVFRDDEGLLVQGRKESLRVRFVDVERVAASEWMNPEIVTLILKRSSKFGPEIKFIPSYRIIPWSEHPISLELSHFVKEANKAPEPTSTSVMSRATVSSFEMKLRTELPIQARATPAVAVAHL